jgi:hypothetical protein
MRFFKAVDPPFFEPKPLKKRYGSLALYYYVPKKSRKYIHWKDGFVAAMEILSENWEIHWVNASRSLPVKRLQPPKDLREFILASKKVYIPASLQGGGERAVWEAKACGVPVEVAEDNPKLVELASSPVQNQEDYAHAIQSQLKTLVL